MSDTSEIVRAEVVSLGGAGRVDAMRLTLQEEASIHRMVGQYMAQQMVKGTDYGEIPGTEKPTLLKPGAEKLVALFRCTPKCSLLKMEEDFERGFFNYVVRVRLYSDGGKLLAEGLGSANSREGRYRWRSANRKCPRCSKETIIRGKEEYGGGWLCFAKKGGCGAKYKAGDQAIEWQAHGQVENDDIATLANTILKMAKKRALVDGAIALARCSDLFTQDVEDYVEPEPPPPPQPQEKPAPAPQTKTARAADERARVLQERGRQIDAARLADERARVEAKPVSQPPPQKPQAPTPVSAPAPKPSLITDVKEGETEDQAKAAALAFEARKRTVYERAGRAGIDKDGFPLWQRDVLKLQEPRKWAALTREDVGKLEAALDKMEPPAGQVEGGKLDDAPF